MYFFLLVIVFVSQGFSELDHSVRNEIFEVQEGKGSIEIESLGQLGNSLFRSATAISLAYDYGLTFVVNEYYKKKYPEIYRNCPLNKGCRISMPNYIHLPHVKKSEISLSRDYSYTIGGYPHDFAYFSHNADLIRNIFGPSKEKKEYLKSKYASLFQDDKAVGIHIRTLFYDLKAEVIGKWNHWYHSFILHSDYYKKAIECFPVNTTFYVFSDKIDVAQKWFKSAKKYDPAFNRKFIFINDSSMVDDFYLLSMLDRLILSHSTFSVFATFLNPNREKVVVWPKRIKGIKGLPFHLAGPGDKSWKQIIDYQRYTKLDEKWKQIMRASLNKYKSKK